MTRAEVVPVDPLHIREICASMRMEEASEIARLGCDPQAMIEYELATSLATYAGVVDGETVVLGGVKVRDILSDEAYVWIICSDRVNEVPIGFVRTVLRCFDEVRPKFASIWGLLVTDFERSVRWVKWLGFTVEQPVNGVSLFWYGRRPNVDLAHYTEVSRGH